MKAEFWHQRWQSNQIAFHEGEANALLVKHFVDAFGQTGGRVFLPLCGKTRDIAWLISRGYHVAGAELSRTAVDQLFAELGIEPKRSDLGLLQHYSADGIDIFVGDIFELSASALGAVDIIYDRAALVALPDEMRKRYAAHLTRITATAPQFLICFDYDQAQMDGPPFSVPSEDIHRCYAHDYDIEPLASINVAGGLKGKCAATENLWLLRPTPKKSR